ncbi:MAG: cytochrome c oxidase subunit 4 [Actinomycetota bacterium]
MNTGKHVAIGLCIYLAVAGIVYGLTSREWRGTAMLLVTAVAALYLGLTFRGAVRRADRTRAGSAAGVAEEEEPRVGPTIWPLVVALGAALLVVGTVGLHVILIPGVIVLVIAGAGWFLDVERQWEP